MIKCTVEQLEETRECFAGFEPWGGAMYTWNVLQRCNKIGVLKAILETSYFCGGMSEVDLNDLLCFESETVCEWVGLSYDSESGYIA
jgi:hypothetical protein